MPWIPDNDAVNAQIDSSIKDSPPNPAMVNTAATVRAALKGMWTVVRNQVQTAVTGMDTIQNNFIARSLTLNATVYVDGLTGNDANSGVWTTVALKSLKRVFELYSGKTDNLLVIINNTVEITENISLSCMSVMFSMGVSGKIYFRKNATNNGNYCINLDVMTAQFTTQSGGLGIIESEAHGGNVTAEATSTYLGRNGCIRLFKNSFNSWRSANKMQALDVRVMSIVAGNNTVVFAGSEAGAQSGELTKSSFFFSGSLTQSIGTGASLQAGFDGSKTFVRTYTPVSSTDVTVLDGELTADATYLYRKNGSTIKKIAWTAF